MASQAENPVQRKSIGIILAQRLYAGLVVDHQLPAEPLCFPAGAGEEANDFLVEMPADAVIAAIGDLALNVAAGQEQAISSVGLALPGLVRGGVVEEAPNLPQLKGAHVQELVTAHLAARGVKAQVTILNDADAVAAGLASQHGKLDHFIRVWTLGTGIGYGRYPFTEGVWEGGHTVVTLDNKETYCGCGGRGHLEGIMGHRAMRLRFLDMEPEEVFEAANRRTDPDPRCLEFKKLWHKALAAASATTIHMGGPGKFYITGYNVRFLDLPLFKDYLHQMVKMSPIQNYSVEVVEDDHLTRIIGAAVAAEQANGR
jgi:predicted NBD/HSP70 family sugar kinase